MLNSYRFIYDLFLLQRKKRRARAKILLRICRTKMEKDEIMKFSRKLVREKWLMDIIIEQLGKKSPLCFFFSRPNSMFYLQQLLLLLLLLLIIIIIITIIIIIQLARTVPVVLCKGNITPIFSQSQRLVTTYNYCSFPSTNHQTYRVL